MRTEPQFITDLGNADRERIRRWETRLTGKVKTTRRKETGHCENDQNCGTITTSTWSNSFGEVASFVESQVREDWYRANVPAWTKQRLAGAVEGLVGHFIFDDAYNLIPEKIERFGQYHWSNWRHPHRTSTIWENVKKLDDADYWRLLGVLALGRDLKPDALADVNKMIAAEQAGRWPLANIQAMADKLGVKPSASEVAKRGVFGLWLAEMATSNHVVLTEYIDAFEADNNVTIEQVRQQSALTGSAGFFSKLSKGFTKLIRHPLKWARRVFVTEVGKGVSKFMQNIIDFTDDLGFLNQFLIKPTGLNVLLTVFRELGDAMEDGSISTFEEDIVMREGAHTFAASGQALMSAAPFLPPPYNVAAAAAGALSLSAAKFINATLDAPLIQKQLDQQAKAKSALATAQANNRNRVFEFMNLAHAAKRLRQGWQDVQGRRLWVADFWAGGRNFVPLALHDSGQWRVVIELPESVLERARGIK